MTNEKEKRIKAEKLLQNYWYEYRKNWLQNVGFTHKDAIIYSTQYVKNKCKLYEIEYHEI